MKTTNSSIQSKIGNFTVNQDVWSQVHIARRSGLPSVAFTRGDTGEQTILKVLGNGITYIRINSDGTETTIWKLPN